MKSISRRSALLAAPSLAFLAHSQDASAQAYPNANIHLLCAFPPGAGLDVLVRYFGEKLRVLCGRTVLVENKPGAAGVIATQALVRSRPRWLHDYGPCR